MRKNMSFVVYAESTRWAVKLDETLTIERDESFFYLIETRQKTMNSIFQSENLEWIIKKTEEYSGIRANIFFSEIRGALNV